MPKTKRDLLKRKLADAYRSITLAMGSLAELQEIFDGVHEKHSQFLKVAIVTLDFARNALTNFATETWGHAPKDWSSWRAQPKRKRDTDLTADA